MVMKKKHRDIIVDDKKYGWIFAPNSDPYESDGELRIYYNRHIIHKEYVEADKIITSKYVAHLIAHIQDYGNIIDK
jgi:hypothetical protein